MSEHPIIVPPVGMTRDAGKKPPCESFMQRRRIPPITDGPNLNPNHVHITPNDGVVMSWNQFEKALRNLRTNGAWKPLAE